MKTTNLLSAGILLAMPLSVLAQEQESKPIKKIIISDIFIQTGPFIERNTVGSAADFKALAPESELMNQHIAAYSSYGTFSLTGNAMFSALLGFQFSNRQKTAYRSNPLLRLGVSYFSSTALTVGSYKENRKTYDTLRSTQTGQTVYMDSINSQSYGANYTSEQLRFDASIIFRTNPQARWSIYTGLGGTLGGSINAYTDIFVNNSDRAEIRGYNTTSSSSYSENYYENSTFQMERHKNRNNFGASAYIPMGVDFRIGKKRDFWKRAHLVYEARPGINLTSIPELRTVTTGSLQHSVGFRVSWN